MGTCEKEASVRKKYTEKKRKKSKNTLTTKKKGGIFIRQLAKKRSKFNDL